MTEPDPTGPDDAADGPDRSVGRSALAVGSGIFLSRVSGFVRDVVIGAFFGTGVAVAAYNAALRIPNVLRNLLGEGTLSASFVPVYSSLLEEASPEEARRLARSVLGLVVALAGVLSALGVLLAPVLTWLVIPAADEQLAGLATGLVRILFPMAGVMIVGAWALGVLSSHRRFLLPFAAPVMWNLAQIGGLLLGRWAGWEPLIYVLAWSTLAGSFLQLAVQLPEVRKLVGGLRPLARWAWEPVRRVTSNAMPVVGSQGIFQLSSWLDFVLASFLPPAALAGLYYAQRLAYLPLSLFGVSVAAASLPEMSRDTAAAVLRRRLVGGFFQILYFVFPAAVAFILFGDLMVAVLFERGAFDAGSTTLVASILTAYALGLVATSSVKLFASGFHALQDTRTPLKYAAVSVVTGAGAGAALMFGLQDLGLGALAVSGLILGGALGAWLNLALLWRGLSRRVGALFERADLLRVIRYALAVALAAGVGAWARPLLEGALPGPGLLDRGLVLLGTLAAAGVPYLLVAGRPPRGTA